MVARPATSIGSSFDDFKIKLEPCSSPISDNLEHDHQLSDNIPTTRQSPQTTPPHHLTTAMIASAPIKRSPSFKAAKLLRANNKRYFINANPKNNTGTSAVTNTHATRGHNDLRISHPMSWALETYLDEKPNIVTVVGDASSASNLTTVPTSTSSSFGRTIQLSGRHHHSTSMVSAANKFRNKSVKSTSKSHVVLSMAAAADAREQTLRRIKRESLTHGDEMVYNGGDAKPWTCRNCKRKYKWKNSLNCHIKNECGKPPKFFCERQCGYKTNINSNLKRHLNSNCKPRTMDETN